MSENLLRPFTCKFVEDPNENKNTIYWTISIQETIFSIDNPYFEGMVKQVYRPELQLNKAIT